MKTIAVLIFTFALSNAFYLDDQPDYNHERQRRDITMEKKVGPGSVFGSLGAPETGGAQGKLGYRGTLMDNNYGRVDGQGHASRTLGLPGGPQTAYGGRLDWSGSRGGASLSADHTRRMGTQVDAQARGTIHQFNKNAKIEGYGGYSQHFAPGIRSRPNYGFGATFRGRF